MIKDVYSLSSRETEVLEWIVLGKANSDISKILNISIYTVKNHVANILRKLGVDNRTQAVNVAFSYNLVGDIPKLSYPALAD